MRGVKGGGPAATVRTGVFPRARGLRWAPGSRTRILPEPAPVRLLIGHWKIGPTREEQHPPLVNIGFMGGGRKAGQVFTFGS